MVLGVIFLGMLGGCLISGFCISRAISQYEEFHKGEEWSDD